MADGDCLCPSRRLRAPLALLLLGATAPQALAAPARHPHAAPKHRVIASDPETLTVTGSRTRRFRAMANTVNVLSGKELADLHIVSPRQIADFVPGVTAVNATSGSTPIFSIRGIGLDDYIGTNMGGIGIYQDGVFAPYPVLYNGQMFDVQAVSVEKGPQGFEYGRSTTGGTINVESIKPSTTFGGYAGWGYGSYGTSTAQAAVNLPLGRHVFDRLAFSYINGDGWQHDIHTGRRYGGQDLFGLRNLTRFDIGESSSLLLNLHYVRDKGRPVSPQNTDGDAVNGTAPGTIALPPGAASNTVNVGGNRVGRNENGGGVGLNFTHSFDWGSFTLATGIDVYRRDDYDNYDGESVHVGDYRWNDTTLAQSHDMHLHATLARRLQLTAGVYESFDRIDGAYTSFRSFLLDNPDGNLTDHFVQQNISAGLYLNTVTTIVQGLDLIAGGRLSWDSRGFHGGTIDDGGALTSIPGGRLTYLDADHRYARLTGRIGLRYTIVPGSFVYGTISNGYKPGAYFAAPVSADSALDYVRPENLIAYELGAKTSLLHDRVQLDGALFDYEYHNRQTLFVAEMPGGITSLSLGPIPRARTRGAELGSRLHDLLPGLDLSGSFAWLDGQTISTVSDISGLPLLGNVDSHTMLPFAPRFSWSAYARYGFDVTRGYRLTLQASNTWKDNMLVALGDPNGRTGKISAMGLRAEIAPRTARWTAAVFVDNVLDRHGTTYSFTGSDNSRVQFVQTPRWLGCDLRYHF